MPEAKDFDAFVRDAREALSQSHSLDEVERFVPSRPGIYAINGSVSTWSNLGLGNPPDDRPLYVGKAEDSLVSRDLKTHFGDGRTGSSTVRRSFAALLHDALGLRGIPRNPSKPGYYSNYGLSAAHDAALTRWMRERLELAVWPKSANCCFALKEIEARLLAELLPPLNLQDVTTPWTNELKAARKAMAAEAEAWTR